MIKFYKRALLLVICSFLGLMTAQAQMPKFTMATTKAVGQSFEFTLNFGPTIQVDWGDGVTVEYTSLGKPIEGKLKGATVSVSGQNITMIDCSDQEITNLNVEEIADLQTLLCAKNKLTELSIKDNTNLYKLNCSYNDITSLRVTELTKLEELNFAHNKLTTPPSFMKNDYLRVLICNNNELTALSVLMNDSIKTLWCHSNKIASLTASKSKKMESLLCYNNNITSLAIVGLQSMKTLWCDNNKLKTIDLSTTIGLTYFSSDNNSLASMKLPSTMNIKNLYLKNNALGFGGLHSGEGVTSFDYSGQYLLIRPETSLIQLNEVLDMSEQLTSLDGKATQAVFNWYGDGNKLTLGTDYTEIEAGKFTFLKSFDRAYCEITSSLFPSIEKITTNTIGVASTAGVENNTNETMKVYAQNGRLFVSIPSEQSLRIYNLMGVLVKSIDSAVGTVEIDLPKGTYIVNNKKIIL